MSTRYFWDLNGDYAEKQGLHGLSGLKDFQDLDELLSVDCARARWSVEVHSGIKSTDQ
jgi:hypothetical protein